MIRRASALGKCWGNWSCVRKASAGSVKGSAEKMNLKRDQIRTAAAAVSNRKQDVPACGRGTLWLALSAVTQLLQCCSPLWWEALGDGGQLRSQDRGHRKVPRFPFPFSVWFFFHRGRAQSTHCTRPARCEPVRGDTAGTAGPQPPPWGQRGSTSPGGSRDPALRVLVIKTLH